ncbi:MAG: hypothetical protein U0270_06870 [Labilithrix sp.]
MKRAGAPALAFVLLSVLVACTADEPSVKPQKVTAGDDDDDDVTGPRDAGPSSSSSSAGSNVIDAATGGAAVSYRGTLEKTPSTLFGGASGHCQYNIVMSAVEIELAITPEGNVIGGTAKNDMTESVAGTCTFAALGKKPMSFAFASMSGQTLTWAQAATGSPKTNLTITLTKNGPSYEGAVKWVRADRTDDLQWTVNTRVNITPK